MAKGLEDFQIQASAVGFDKAADQVNKLNEAKRALGAPDDEAAKGAEKLHETQQKVNASSETYVSLLTRINPMLGVFADSMVKATRVVGDFANAQINVAGIMAKATAAIRANANALKLFLVGGGLAAGVWAIVHAVTALMDAHKRAEEAAIAHRKAITDLNREAKDMAAEAAFARARMPYREAPTEAEFRSMVETLQEAPSEIRQMMIPYVAAFGGGKGFGPAPGPFTSQELQQMGRLQAPIAEGPEQVQLDTMFAWQRQQADTRRTTTRLEQFLPRLEREGARRAVLEGPEGGLEDFREVVKDAAKGYGLEVQQFTEDLFARLRREVETTGGIGPARGQAPQTMGVWETIALAAGGRGHLLPRDMPLGPDMPPTGTAQEITVENIVRRQLREQPPVTIVHHNARQFWAPVEVMRRAITNGESMGRDFE